jgi:hypothetical protein
MERLPTAQKFHDKKQQKLVLRQFVPTDISFFVELKYLTC